MDEQQTIRLVLQAQAGSREAFGALVKQFEPAVFATVMSRLRHRAEAREATQDVFLQAMRKLHQLREPERFGGWLRQIAVRLSINRAVRRPNETNLNPTAINTLKLKTKPVTPLDDLLTSERSREVWGGLQRLARPRPANVDRLLHGRPVAQADERPVRQPDRHDQAASAHRPQPAPQGAG